MATSRKGWFSTPNRPGDRTLEQQLKGLDLLFSEVHGRSVLDIGCAEGLIAFELADAGALCVHGVEIVPEHVHVAQALVNGSDLDCTFEVADANTYTPRQHFDIVIALALLHKLRRPDLACERFATFARDLVVLRLPPQTAPTIVDARSGGIPYDMGAVLANAGFVLADVRRGHFNEWCGYYRRVNR